MASGDVFANMYIPVTLGSVVDVQPAGTTQVLISFIGTNDNDDTRFSGTNAAGNTGFFVQGLGNGDHSIYVKRMINMYNMKLFITNSQYITLATEGGARFMAYSGIEI